MVMPSIYHLMADEINHILNFIPSASRRQSTLYIMISYQCHTVCTEIKSINNLHANFFYFTAFLKHFICVDE